MKVHVVTLQVCLQVYMFPSTKVYVFKYVFKYVYSWSRVYIHPYKYDTSMFPKKWKWKVYVFGQAHTPPSLASQ
jgi:hypothetical protein